MAEIIQDTNFGFEQRFRKALLRNESSFASYEQMINYYIDLNRDGCLFNKKTIQIPIVFHIVEDGTDTKISKTSIQNVVNSLNDFYRNFRIVFKLAIVNNLGEKMHEPGIQRHDFSEKVIGYTPTYVERTYAMHGIKIKDDMLTTLVNSGQSNYVTYYADDLKEELHWDVTKYFNVYLVNSLRGFEQIKESYSNEVAADLLKELGMPAADLENSNVLFLESDFKYSDIVNSVTAEITNDFNSFGIIIPFYALPNDKVDYSYADSQLPTLQNFSASSGQENYIYFLGENIPNNGNMISIIHAVAVSFNLLSLYSCPFSDIHDSFISKCLPAQDYTSSFFGNNSHGDGCLDTPNILFDEYLMFRESNMIFACNDKEDRYYGDNLMAHPYFVDNKYGQNVIMPFPNFKLSEYQKHRIRANFFIFTEDSPTILHSLSNSFTAGAPYKDPDCFDPLEPVDPIDPINPTDPDPCKDPEVFTNNPDISEKFLGTSNASIESVSYRIAYSLRNANLDSLEKSVRDFNKLKNVINSIK